VIGGIAVAAIGFVDDRRPVSASARLAVHVAAAIWAIVCLGAAGWLQVGQLIGSGWLGAVLAALGLVWALNLFNFMDGIDGIAAAEAVFIAWGGAALMHISGNVSAISDIGLIIGAACAGFLIWNWPPARIFMGDVGSGYLGYALAVLALASARDRPSALWAWLILGGAFFVDATVTLLRRALRRERVHQAHRSHAYQWLARRWGSHRRVTLTVMAVNMLWLLPSALCAVLYPQWAAWIALGALSPLALAALLAGAGRTET
jgi:Fuc2NAc and GlcNAc transferase